MRITFVTGGARSGKSSFALSEAERSRGSKVYVATAEALDGEMAGRIEAHRRDRPDHWETLEVPLELPRALRQAASTHEVAVVDCLTLWLSNILSPSPAGGAEGPTAAVDELSGTLEALKERPGTLLRLLLVSNEIGMGIVPADGAVRAFRDRAGRLNQLVAAAADEVYLMVSGQPLKVKG